MAKRNRNYDKAALLADWRTGEYNQRQLADKYKVVPATVNNLIKGVKQDIEPLISAQVSIKQELAKFNERERELFDKIVNTKTAHIQFFTDAAVLNVQQALAAPCEGQADFKARAETISKGKEVVLGKEPSAAIQINNTQNVSSKTVSDDDLINIATGSR